MNVFSSEISSMTSTHQFDPHAATFAPTPSGITSAEDEKIGIRLPVEIILHIIDLCAPPNEGAIVPHSHPSARTLLAFTLVCSFTYPTATRLLRQHGTYINSSSKLARLLRRLEREPSSDIAALSRACHLHQMNPLLPATKLPVPNPDPKPLAALTSLYLAPFTSSTLDILAAALWARSLLQCCSPTLVRLVLDIPPNLSWQQNKGALRRALNLALHSTLPALEEFTAVRPDSHLDVVVPSLWQSWPRLRRLALSGELAGAWLWTTFVTERLEKVVLTRTTGVEWSCPKTVLKLAWEKKGWTGVGEEGKDFTVVLVDVENDQPTDRMDRSQWQEIDPDGRITIMTYDVPTSFYGDEPAQRLCEDWVLRGALNGEIWDWEGTILQPTAKEVAET